MTSLWRSREPSRLEGFSDAVFGFALTLLVVSLDVPRTFDQLWSIVRGFLPFVFTFATIVWLWYEHYIFFRRFDPDDRVTIVLNAALLFMVLFYVYPLKFLFTLVIDALLGLNSFDAALPVRGDSVRLMVVYGLGFVVVFVTLSLLYLNVWRRRASLQLSPIEVFEARVGAIQHVMSASVGALSVSIVLIGGDQWAAVSGMSYSLLGVVHGVLGFRFGSRRAALTSRSGLS